MNGHDELISLLGAYALDAVDDDERRSVEDHLELCADCRAEVGRHLEVAAALGAAAAAPAPDDLWATIKQHLDGNPTSAPEAPPLLGPAPPVLGEPLPPPGSRDTTVASLDERRRPIGIIAGLAAAAIVVVLLAAGLVQTNRENDRLERELAARSMVDSIDELAASALTDPANRVLELRADGGSGDTATAVITPDGAGFLVSTTLDPLPADRTYQLWNIGDASAVSLGVLGSAPRASAFRVQGPVTTLAITAERAGGVPSPENIPLLTSTT